MARIYLFCNLNNASELKSAIIKYLNWWCVVLLIMPMTLEILFYVISGCVPIYMVI